MGLNECTMSVSDPLMYQLSSRLHRIATLLMSVMLTDRSLSRSPFLDKSFELTLSRPGGHFVPPHLNHSISSKRLGVWSYGFVNFRFMYFPFRKVQFHQSALMYVAMATMQFFGLFLKVESLLFFKYST